MFGIYEDVSVIDHPDVRPTVQITKPGCILSNSFLILSALDGTSLLVDSNSSSCNSKCFFIRPPIHPLEP